MTISFKKGFHLMRWRPLATSFNAHAAWGCIDGDYLRGTAKSPWVFQLASATVLNAYNWVYNGWVNVMTPAMAGTFGAGTAIKLNPTHGPSGTIAAGATSSTITLSTALPAAVGQNSLANRGDGLGLRIRIYGDTAGGSGKCEVRRITSNTAGTTPVITLDSALSFTPAAGSRYEILGGRLYILNAGTTAAGIFKYFDLTTWSMSGNLATTNLPATIGTDSTMLALCEEYVPSAVSDDQLGFLGVANTATAIAAGTLTGGAETVALNEYRNFVVKIVQDTVNPTAVGQRRKISSHTAGPNPVYTLASNWTVNPSTSALYVIVNDHDKMILKTSASTSTFCYNVIANTWDTSTFAVSPAANGVGNMLEQAFSITPDAQKSARHSHLYFFRGNATTLDVFDIAGAATGSWTADVAYAGKSLLTTWAAGSGCCHCSVCSRLFMNRSGAANAFFAFDMLNRSLYPMPLIGYAFGTAAVGQRLAPVLYDDGTDVIPGILVMRCAGAEMFRLDIWAKINSLHLEHTHEKVHPSYPGIFLLSSNFCHLHTIHCSRCLGQGLRL